MCLRYLQRLGWFVGVLLLDVGVLFSFATFSSLEAYCWSSYPLYVGQTSQMPGWLRVDRLLGEWGILWDRAGAGRQFAGVMEARRQAELQEEFKPVSGDWCVGSEQFRTDMLRYVDEQRGKWHYGSELWESAQAKAEHLIVEALRNQGLPEAQLGRWRKGHPFKIKLALRLRAETTVTLDWIARRLKMGTRGHLAHLLQVHNHPRSQPPSSDQLALTI